MNFKCFLKLKCLFGFHTYDYMYNERQLITCKGQKHVRFERKHYCRYCDHQTEWMRLSECKRVGLV